MNAAKRPLVSYADIALPYDTNHSSLPPNPSKPPAKKRKWNKPKTRGGNTSHSANGSTAIPQNISSQSQAETQEGICNTEESRELTYDEIWDDSALIDAWNAATEEYEAYNGPDKGWKMEPVHKSPLYVAMALFFCLTQVVFQMV